ncbi:hypothetical protein K2X05_06130 [bacterium]|nr:hypothetical protein [bacterium]
MKILLSLVLLTCSTVFAGVQDVSPTTEKVSLATVQQVIVLQQEPRVQLVKVDNGGSTDISSVMAPSSMYLTVFKQGEEFDIEATYLVLGAVDKIKSYSYDSKNKVIDLVTTNKNDSLQTIKMKSKVYVGELLKQVDYFYEKGVSEDPITATVGIQSAEL